MLRKLSFLYTFRNRIRFVWSALQDENVPLWKKAIPFLPLLYILSPINLISFTIPLLGQIDNITLILLALDAFEKVVEKDIKQKHHVEPRLVERGDKEQIAS